MHPNPIFRAHDEREVFAMVAERGFGVLTCVVSGELRASHVPFVVQERSVRAHLVRSNPIARALGGENLEAMVIVSGADAYVSPDWYGVADQVPTWNYVAVHLRGTLRALDEADLLPHLEMLSASNESRLAPKEPWTLDKVDPEVRDSFMRQIIPVAMDIRRVECTRKLSQNKTAAVRLAAAEGVAHSPLGYGQSEMAERMRSVPETD